MLIKTKKKVIIFKIFSILIIFFYFSQCKLYAQPQPNVQFPYCVWLWLSAKSVCVCVCLCISHYYFRAIVAETHTRPQGMKKGVQKKCSREVNFVEMIRPTRNDDYHLLARGGHTQQRAHKMNNISKYI